MSFIFITFEVSFSRTKDTGLFHPIVESPPTLCFQPQAICEEISHFKLSKVRKLINSALATFHERDMYSNSTNENVSFTVSIYQRKSTKNITLFFVK